MTKSDIIKSLDPSLTFSRFNQLTRKREELYEDFIKIDEPHEISEQWVSFSGNVVEELLEVIKLTKSYLDRLIDGIRRGKEGPASDDLGNIKQLTEFWLDLSIMSYLYSTIEKRGVFGLAANKKITQGYMETKRSFDDLIILAFQTGREFFTPTSLMTLGELLYLKQEKTRLDFMDQIKEENEQKNEILGDYDLKQASFLLTRVKDRLMQSSKSWWFKDPVGIKEATDHALSHIDSMGLNWASCSSDLIKKGLDFAEKEYPSAKSFSDLSLAQHFKTLGIEALIARENDQAASYFNQAVELTKPLGVEDIDLKSNSGFWGDSIQNQYLIYEQMSSLSKISVDYENVIGMLKENKSDESLEILETALTKIENILSLGDLAYVSSVAISYESVFLYTQEQIKLRKECSEIIPFVEKSIKSVANRLHKATDQYIRNWKRVLKKGNENLDALQEIVRDIEYPLMALLILPPNQENVINSVLELIAIGNATESIRLSIKAETVFGKNPVKEMLIRAKSYQHSTQAIKTLDGDKEKDPEMTYIIDKVLKPLQFSSLLRGLIAEIQLRSAVLQYEFVNSIGSLLGNSGMLQKSGDITELDTEKILDFQNSVQELKMAGDAIMTNQEKFKTYSDTVNWSLIENLVAFSNGLHLIIDVVKESSKALRSSDVDDIIDSWDKAKNLAYKASESISKAQSQQSEKLSTQVYSLAQLLGTFENKARSRSALDDFPVLGIIELLQTLVMGI